MKQKIGFTLIEIMVATTIVAVLAAVGMVSYASATKKSRDAKRMADIAQIQSALEMFRSDSSPSTYIVGNNLSGLVPGYLPKIPAPPKSTDEYYYAGAQYSYCLYTTLEDTSSSCDPNVCAAVAGKTFNYCVKNP